MNATFHGWRAPIVPILALAFAAAFGIAAAAEPPASTGESSPVEVEISAEQLRLASEHKAEMRGSKISGSLTQVFEEHVVRAQRKAPGIEPSEAPKGSLRMLTLAWVVNGEVIIDVAAEDDVESLREQLAALGFTETARFGRILSGRLPIESIGALNDVPGLRFASASFAKVRSGKATSQGDRVMWADQARERFGVSGAGQTVGILSDSFDCIKAYRGQISRFRGTPIYRDDIRSGDLPSNVRILAEPEGCEPYGYWWDEGRALAQVVHDVAPGAALAFHTAVNGIADFAQGIIRLARDGATIIVDDVIYYAEPMFQDGPIAQAVDQVAAAGVTYVSSAGNEAEKSYEAPFRPVMRDGRIYHDFDPGNAVVTAQTVTFPPWGQFLISFQWDEPFYSASGAPGSSSNIDLHFYYQGEYLFSCDDNNTGRDAVELCWIVNDGPIGVSIQMVVELSEGPVPGVIKFVNFENASFNFATHSPTCFGHDNAKGAIAVGAADYRMTPACGRPTPVAEAFSAAGGVPILFDMRGNRLAQPMFREAPWILGPDGVDTTFFLRWLAGSDTDGTGWPNFYGTSAAAPHVAAVAALMREESPAMTTAEVRKRLAQTAIKPGAAGWHPVSGYGFVDAEFAVGGRPLGPDLTASWLPGTVKQTCTTKAGVTTCSRLAGTLKVVNVGSCACKPITIAFYLSADATPEADEQVQPVKTISRLCRDKTLKIPVSVNLAARTGGASVAGQHLIAVIDPAHETIDPDDNNLIVGLIP